MAPLAMAKSERVIGTTAQVVDVLMPICYCGHIVWGTET